MPIMEREAGVGRKAFSSPDGANAPGKAREAIT